MSLDDRALPQIQSTELHLYLSPLWNPLFPWLLSAPDLSHTNPRCSELGSLVPRLQFAELCSSLALSPCLFSTWSSFEYLYLHLQTLFLQGNLSLDFRTAWSRGKIKLSLKTSNLIKPLKLMTKCLWKQELLSQMLEQKCPFPPPMTVCRASLQVMQVAKRRAVPHEFLCCSCPSFGNTIHLCPVGKYVGHEWCRAF